MKNIIFLLLLFVLYPVIVSAQGPGSCACQSFPFYFCPTTPGAGEIIICAVNPYNIPGGYKPSQRANAKVCMGTGVTQDVCLSYLGGDAHYIQLGANFAAYFGTNVNGYLDGPSNQTPISYLENMWYHFLYSTVSACGYNTSHSQSDCCVYLYMVTDPTLFSTLGVSKVTGAFPLGFTPVSYDLGTCQLNCNDQYIYINVTDNFYYDGTTPAPGDDQLYPVRYWNIPTYIGQPDPSGNVQVTFNPPTSHEYDFASVWFHELWHWLGFPHQNEPDSTGQICDQDNNSIMHTPRSIGTVQLWDDMDKCWFEKLYCNYVVPKCLSSVTEEKNQIRILLLESIPNPFKKSVTVKFSLSSPSTVSISVLDNLGKVVDNILNSSFLETPENEIEYTPHNLSEGIYYLRLEANGTVQTVKLVYESGLHPIL